MRLTRQFDRMDCGPACVRMVASHFGKTFPLSYIRSRSHLTKEGVSVSGIRDALGAIGIDSASFEMTPGELADNCPVPVILYWEQRHFVVLYRIKRNRRNGKCSYMIADPAFGKHTCTDEEFNRSWLNGDKGVVIAVEPTDRFYAMEPERGTTGFRKFARKYVWPYRRELIQSCLAMLFGILLSMITPLLTKTMVDDGIGMRDTGLIFNILMAQVFLFFGSFTMNLIGGWVTLYMSTHININILDDYLHKMLRLPMTFFETKGAGDYNQRLNDHGRLQNFMTNSSVQTLFSLLSVPFYLIIIGSYSPLILMAYLLFTVAGIGWMCYFFNRRKAIDYEQFKLKTENQNKLYEIISGITEIKLNSYEEHKIGEWRAMQQRLYAMNQKVLKLEQLQNTGFTVLSQMRNIFITCWIALDVVYGTLTLGTMMSVSVIIGLVSGPLSQLIDFMRQWQDARISLERSNEVHANEDEDYDGMLMLEQETPKDIELRDVTFSYTGTGGKKALDGVSMTIEAGKMTAIVGESGSGKTTLLKLLLKFYTPDSGEILWGGKRLDEYSAASVRRATGMVMQDNYVFSDTLRNNIIMGCGFDRERFDRALVAGCLRDFVERMPLHDMTKVGAEGNGISGGERQRIMLARAVYKQPVYLMLDEATSSLDAGNERRITDNLDRICHGMTRVVIAHRLSTVRNADQIVVLQRGRVVETGTHAELVERQGYYYKLIQNQLELAE